MSKFGGMRSQTVAAVLRPLPLVLAAFYLFMTHFAPDRSNFKDVFGRSIEGQPLNSAGLIYWFTKDAGSNMFDAFIIGALLCSFVWFGILARPLKNQAAS